MVEDFASKKQHFLPGTSGKVEVSMNEGYLRLINPGSRTPVFLGPRLQDLNNPYSKGSRSEKAATKTAPCTLIDRGQSVPVFALHVTCSVTSLVMGPFQSLTNVAISYQWVVLG